MVMAQAVLLLEKGQLNRAVQILQRRLKRCPGDWMTKDLLQRVKAERRAEEAALPSLARKVARARRAKPKGHGRLSASHVWRSVKRMQLLEALRPQIQKLVRTTRNGKLIVFLYDFGFYDEHGEHFAVAGIASHETVGDLLDRGLEKLRPGPHRGIIGFFERRSHARQGYDLRDWDSPDGWHLRVECTEHSKDDVELAPLSLPLSEAGLRSGDTVKLYRKDWPQM